jgi:peptidyl-tRNA hydrolase, PTH1 family
MSDTKMVDLVYPKTRAVIGLGNVGPRFDLTPHNIGFAALDALAAEAGVQFEAGKMKSALTAEVTHGDYTLLLVKPATGMNDSGDALAELLNEMGYDFPQIMVIYDDLSFPFGRMKMKVDGSRSSAGHNGVASLIAQLPETRTMAKLKLGIGPDPGGANRFTYVLKPVEGDVLTIYQAVAREAGKCVKLWLDQGLDAVFRVYNHKDFEVR